MVMGSFSTALASSTASSASADKVSHVAGAGDFGAALAQLGLAAELGVDRLDLLDQRLGFQLVGAQQLGEFLLLFGQRGMLAADFHFFQLAQGAQPHVEDGFGLIVVEAETPSSVWAWAHPRCG